MKEVAVKKIRVCCFCERWESGGIESFLHNVLREMLGIILLPVIAGKIGYIEAITIPGTASTDVCLPIIERVCNSETVAYSFCTGMLMCITSAALVPIIIGA